MAKASRNLPHSRQAHKQASRVPLFFVLGGALIFLIAAFFALQKPSSPAATPEVTGRASLKVDEEKIDLGNVRLGTTVQASFEISNVGDQPLQITKDPYIQVIEGC